MVNPYIVLSVAEDVSDAEIGRRFRELARSFHPDIAPIGGPDFSTIGEAYSCLKSREARDETDTRLREERRRAADAEARPAEPTAPAKTARKKRRRRRADFLPTPLVRRPPAFTFARRPAPTRFVRRPPPMPFTNLASTFARTRPASEERWWTILGAAADIWLATRCR